MCVPAGSGVDPSLPVRRHRSPPCTEQCYAMMTSGSAAMTCHVLHCDLMQVGRQWLHMHADLQSVSFQSLKAQQRVAQAGPAESPLWP